MSTLKNTLNLVQQHWQKYSPCGQVVQLEEFWLSNHCRYLHCCCCYWSFYGGCYVIPSFIFWQLPPACFASICCSNCPPSIHPQMDKYVFYSTQTQKKMKNNKFIYGYFSNLKLVFCNPRTTLFYCFQGLDQYLTAVHLWLPLRQPSLSVSCGSCLFINFSIQFDFTFCKQRWFDSVYVYMNLTPLCIFSRPTSVCIYFDQW